MAKDSSNKDFDALQIDGAVLSSQARSDYNKLIDIKVSPRLEEAKTNYLKGLLDAEKAGDYMSKASIAVKNGDYTNGLDYLKQALTYTPSSNQYYNMATASLPK